MGRGGVVTQKKARRRRGRPKAEDCSDDDEEYVVEDDGEDESSEELFGSSDSVSLEPSEAEFDSEEEEIGAARPRSRSKPRARTKPRKAAARGGRRRGARAPAKRKPRGGVGSRTRRASVSDDDEEDEDFDPDDVDEEVSLISSTRSVLHPCPKRKRSRASSKPKNDAKKDERINLENQNSRGNRKRKRLVVEVSDSSDFDYEVSSEEEDEEEEEEERPRGQLRRKKRSRILDSESEFSDFVVSEDEEKVRGRGRPRKTRNERKKRSRLVDSESDFSDFVISDEELRDLGIVGELVGHQHHQHHQHHQQPKKIVAEKKEEEKGKEKAEVDSGKQVCGICLSEEKKTTIQGVLECCAHYFCFACIMEWSKVESRCPVCKRRFASISKSGGPLNPGLEYKRAVIRVPKRDQVYQPSEEEMRGFLDPYENVVCIECQQGGDDYLMLLCDICDTPSHTYCVGLGREVPDGNWYCEGCRPTGDRLTNLQVQVTATDLGASSADPLSGHFSFTGIDNYRNTNSSAIQQSATPQGQSPFLGIDLNVSPRYPWREEHESASQSPRAGASTLSGRRAIQQRIRILFNRSRQSSARDATNDMINAGVERGRPLQQSDNQIHQNPLHNISNSVQFQQNNSPFIQQNAYFSPCSLNEGSSFRLVDGAKEQVQSMVRSHMKSLSRNIQLERVAYKDVVPAARPTPF
ncbi:hypothetical protein J5N97_014014 [Dioscorea zingiberensis]|uniref:Uncharacterized protein n=1 Tax=Dioscorea zingiberensis TaxID=325984 RepID=A0A9D5HJ37_9LILI|nr:hypothetical protein J5N97_014014 [Dioscorea zingiberensis]